MKYIKLFLMTFILCTASLAQSAITLEELAHRVENIEKTVEEMKSILLAGHTVMFPDHGGELTAITQPQ